MASTSLSSISCPRSIMSCETVSWDNPPHHHLRLRQRQSINSLHRLIPHNRPLCRNQHQQIRTSTHLFHHLPSRFYPLRKAGFHRVVEHHRKPRLGGHWTIEASTAK